MLITCSALFAIASIAHPLSYRSMQVRAKVSDVMLPRTKDATPAGGNGARGGADHRPLQRRPRRRAGAAGVVGSATAYLHIGPHKTGSSSLQTALLGPLRDPLLELDQIEVPIGIPGRKSKHKNHASLARAVDAIARARARGRTASKGARETWQWTRSWLTVALARNPEAARILLVSEAFATVPPDGVALLMQTLAKAGFARAHVILTYRRLFERLPSMHSQLFLHGANRGAKEYAPLVDWLEGAATERKRAMSECYNQTARLHDVYTRLAAPHSSTRVSVINMHDVASTNASAGPSLLHTMVCDHLQAAGTCAKLTAADDAVRANVRSRVVARLKDLTWAAAHAQPELGFSTKVVDEAAVSLLSTPPGSAAAAALALVPTRCVNESVLQQMLSATEDEERALFGHVGKSLRTDFARRKADGMFCSADSRAALRMPAVRDMVLAALDAAAANAD